MAEKEKELQEKLKKNKNRNVLIKYEEIHEKDS